MSETILVTGGAGFIGSNLLLALQKEYPGVSLIAVDNFQSSHYRNLQGYQGDLLFSDLYEDRWRRWVDPRKVRAVFHMASLTDTTVTDPKAHLRCNLESWRNLLDHFSQSHARIVYASSASVYGTRPGVQKVGDPLAPANAYAFSKVQMENLAEAYCRENPARRVVGLRYFNVYGPREAHKGPSASMVWQLAVQLKEGKRPRLFRYGEQRRDFVYVKDAVRATLAAGSVALSGGHWLCNVGSGRSYSFLELLSLLQGTLGKSGEPEFFDCPYPFYQTHTEADLSHTKALLGYAPTFSLEKGIEDYCQSGWLP
jgi:ADP-L-glycero-D-manno-heptose 6-epimerase